MEYSDYLSLREDILAWLKPRLKDSRYQHTLRVEQLSVSLARLYAPDDYQSASIAALLHDNAKNLCLEKQLKLCDRYYPNMGLTMDYPSILHAFAGAGEAKTRYPEISDDIVNAICYHTTGRPGMSTLEKIIYCADYAEPGRDLFPGLEETRRRLTQDLDLGLIMILNQTAEYVVGRGKAIHPLTIRTIRYYHDLISNHESEEQDG